VSTVVGYLVGERGEISGALFMIPVTRVVVGVAASRLLHSLLDKAFKGEL